MENFDLKKFLVENKLTTNSKLLKEEYEGETVEQAFRKADIDLAKPITAVPSERAIMISGLTIQGDHPISMLGGKFAKILEQERLQRLEEDPDQDEYEEVLYNFSDDINPGTGELMGEDEDFEEYTKGLTCKLEVYFGDFMFEIWQKDSNLKADPSFFSVNENSGEASLSDLKKHFDDEDIDCSIKDVEIKKTQTKALVIDPDDFGDSPAKVVRVVNRVFNDYPNKDNFTRLKTDPRGYGRLIYIAK
jgi:hypothetical protein